MIHMYLLLIDYIQRSRGGGGGFNAGRLCRPRCGANCENRRDKDAPLNESHVATEQSGHDQRRHDQEKDGPQNITRADAGQHESDCEPLTTIQVEQKAVVRNLADKDERQRETAHGHPEWRAVDAERTNQEAIPQRGCSPRRRPR